jgi:CRP/FNR family transcriptional regulator, cyclic AMP receptor protein
MSLSETYDPLGYLASLLVLATFSMRGMAALRALAIVSNLAFIVYAALAQIYPVLLLHALLLPVNLSRLSQALRAQLVCDEEKFKPTQIS